MNEKLFAEFCKLGLSAAREPDPHTILNKDCEEVDPLGSPREYAFYFARLCMSDVRGRHVKEWQMMPWLKWQIFRVGYAIQGLFKNKVVKKVLTKEELSERLEQMVKSQP